MSLEWKRNKNNVLIARSPSSDCIYRVRPAGDGWAIRTDVWPRKYKRFLGSVIGTDREDHAKGYCENAENRIAEAIEFEDPVEVEDPSKPDTRDLVDKVVFGTIKIKTRIGAGSIETLLIDDICYQHVYDVEIFPYGIEFKCGGTNYFYTMDSVVWFRFTPDKETD